MALLQKPSADLGRVRSLNASPTATAIDFKETQHP
jgi:hypothetical protein